MICDIHHIIIIVVVVIPLLTSSLQGVICMYCTVHSYHKVKKIIWEDAGR